MTAVPEAVTVLDVVSRLTTPIAHLAVVLAPGMDGTVADSNLSPASSLAFKIGSLVHVAVDVATNAGDGIGSG